MDCDISVMCECRKKKKKHSRFFLRALPRGRMREMRRELEVPEERVPVEECLDCRARIASAELAPLHSVKKWYLPECLFYKSENGCRFGEKCSYAHRQVEEQPSKRSKKNNDNCAVAMVKRNEQHQRTGRLVLDAYSSSTRQLGCVFQDMEPPKSSSILLKSSNMRKPIRRVKFTKAIARRAYIRDQNPSLGLICPGDPHQRHSNVPNLRIGLRKKQSGKIKVPAKQRGGRQKVLKLKEHERATFFSQQVVCLRHQLLNLRKEKLLSIPVRQCA